MNDKLRLPLCDNDACFYNEVPYPFKNLHDEVEVEVTDPNEQVRKVTSSARMAANTGKTVRFCDACFNAVATAAKAMKQDPLLHVSAKVRYWEDAIVNRVEDKDGTLIPFRNGDLWEPTINLRTGQVVDWPKVHADIHYKVCAGEYWVTTSAGLRLKWKGDYVPDEFLCQDHSGSGDYISLIIDGSGQIEDWYEPDITPEEWVPVMVEQKPIACGECD